MINPVRQKVLQALARGLRVSWAFGILNETKIHRREIP